MEWIDSKRLIFKKLIYWSIMLFLYMSLDSCIKPYLAPQSVANLGYLVVDGTIVKDTVTTIKLSRTRNVDDTGKVVPETNAQLFIEGKSGDLFTFQSIQDGVYTSNTEALQTDNEYRLRIIAADGKEYMSDFVTVRITPDIDSVEWLQEDDIFIKVNTHDPSNKTIYYRWEYFETIEYRVPYESYMDYRNGEIVFIEPDEYRQICYSHLNSSDILLGSTASLSEDIISHHLLTTVKNDNEKISHRYSILVKQYALTPEAYKYWQILKLNTEQTGNLFDPQPAQLNGNIHCVSNPLEPVIGFVSASTVSQKRIFIRRFQLRDPYNPPVDYLCLALELSPSDALKQLSEGFYLPAYNTTRGLIGIALKRCVDCRLKGGTTIKPSYW